MLFCISQDGKLSQADSCTLLLLASSSTIHHTWCLLFDISVPLPSSLQCREGDGIYRGRDAEAGGGAEEGKGAGSDGGGEGRGGDEGLEKGGGRVSPVHLP